MSTVDPDGVLTREGIGIHATSAATLAAAIAKLAGRTGDRQAMAARAWGVLLQQSPCERRDAALRSLSHDTDAQRA
ncbi:MAG: hypothetical protein R3E84_11535 [Pseudomonadales bacterium]